MKLGLHAAQFRAHYKTLRTSTLVSRQTREANEETVQRALKRGHRLTVNRGTQNPHWQNVGYMSYHPRIWGKAEDLEFRVTLGNM